MKPRLLALVGATVMAILPLTTAQPASAATRCPQNYACSWTSANFEGNEAPPEQLKRVQPVQRPIGV